MKKILVMTALLALGGTMAYAGPCQCQKPETPMGPPPCHCGAKKPCPPKVNVEQKLKLTEEQKAKAKALRMEAREQMRPLIEAIKTKNEQKEVIKHNRSLTAEAQCEQIEKLNNQTNELRKQIREIRIKNERDFEALLTPKQKKELDKIKADARKEMAKKYKECASKGQPKK